MTTTTTPLPAGMTAALGAPRLEAIVQDILAYRQAGRCPPSEAPLWPLQSEDEAWAVQSAVAARIGDSVAGWKLGATNATARARLNLARPFLGRIYAAESHRSGEAIGGRLPDGCQLEVELAFVFGDSLPARAEPYNRQEVAAAVSSCHAAIELVTCTLGGPKGLRGFDIGVSSFSVQ